MSSWFHGIKGKLLFAACFPLIGFIAAFLVANSGLKSLDKIIDTAHGTLIPNYEALGSMRSSRLSFNVNMRDALENPGSEEFVVEAEKALNDYKSNYHDYTQNPFITGEAEIHDSAKDNVKNIIALMDEALTLVKSKDPESLKNAEAIVVHQLPKLGKQLAASFNNKVYELYIAKAAEEKQLAETTHAFVFNMLILSMALAGLATFAILIWIAASISNAVLGVSLKLADSSTQVTNAVVQLDGAGNSLSSSATEAAASLEETVASLEEMTSMVKMGSDNARQAAALSSSARDSAETGAQEIQNLIKSMNQISSSSKKIEEIISVIDDIAFQTNLLALNAAVEAARAGEQGKGFAVVADAVRGLAQRSASSAKDITTLIKESVEQIEHGSDIADKSGAMLSNIVTSIKKVSDLNTEIASASQEQATGIEQINRAMSQLDQAGQANAASAEEISATTGEISELAKMTQALTVDLKTLVLGQQSAAASQAPSVAATPAAKASRPVIAKGPVAVPKKETASKQAAHKIPFGDEEDGGLSDASGF